MSSEIPSHDEVSLDSSERLRRASGRQLFFRAGSLTLLLGLGLTGTLGLLAWEGPTQKPEFSLPDEEQPTSKKADAVGLMEAACGYFGPRYDSYLNNLSLYSEGSLSTMELAIETHVLAERARTAATYPGIDNNLFQWLGQLSGRLDEATLVLLETPEGFDELPVSDSEIGDFVAHCPDFEDRISPDGLEVPAAVPFSIFYLGAFEDSWLTCAFTHLDPATAAEIGAESAVLSYFVESDGKLLHFQQVNIPLDQSQLERSYLTDMGEVFVIAGTDMGPIEGFQFDNSLLPTDGDFSAGCFKQYEGEVEFPRVVERVSLDSSMAEKFGLRP